jgi:NitT/TauT family transport system ATP-binding protein
VEEAIYLGDRVVMLGCSPGRVIGEVTVPFPRPRRRRELFTAPEFHRLSDTISDHYHSEVLEHIHEAWTMTGLKEGI